MWQQADQHELGCRNHFEQAALHKQLFTGFSSFLLLLLLLLLIFLCSDALTDKPGARFVSTDLNGFV